MLKVFCLGYFGSIPTQPKQTKMILTPLPFQCVIKCVLWGEGVNKNYLEIWDDKRRLPGYLIYVHQLPKIHEQWKSPWSLGYIGCNYIGDNFTTESSGDYKKPLSSSWLTNQYDGKCEFFFRGSHVATTMIWGYPKDQTRQLMIESWHNCKHGNDQTTTHDVFKDVPWYDAHEPAGRSHFGEKLRNLNKNMRWIHSYWMSRLELGITYMFFGEKKGVAPLSASESDRRNAGIAAKLQGDVGVTWQPRNWGETTATTTTTTVTGI